MNVLQTVCTTYDYNSYTQLAFLWVWLILVIIHNQHYPNMYMHHGMYQKGNTVPMDSLIITLPSFHKDTLLAEAFTLPMYSIYHVIEHLGISVHFAFRLWCLVRQNHVIMDLTFNDNHIIYYQRDVQWCVGLEQIYLISPGYLVVHCCICFTFFHPNTINPQSQYLLLY